jgi:phosphohistidine phosphatase
MASGGSAPCRALWLLRHGKARRQAPGGGGDRERPLEERGRIDARDLGRRMGGQEPVLGLDGVPSPALVICSAAVRTRQTADLVVGAHGGGLPVEAYRSLYGAGTDLLLRTVHEVDDSVAAVLVVGHNPTVAQLAWELLSDEDTADRLALEAHGFPTCGLAVLTAEVGGWEDLGPGDATLAGLFRPPY